MTYVLTISTFICITISYVPSMFFLCLHFFYFQTHVLSALHFECRDFIVYYEVVLCLVSSCIVGQVQHIMSITSNSMDKPKIDF